MKIYTVITSKSNKSQMLNIGCKVLVEKSVFKLFLKYQKDYW